VSKPPDIKDLRRLLRRCGIELRSAQERVEPVDYIVALHEQYGDILTPDMILYGFDQFAWSVGKKAMKDLEAEAEGLTESRQMVLPGSLAHIKVPKALPIEINGKSITVTAVACTIVEGDAYTASLQKNINGCIENLTDWQQVWEPARKVMVEHPGWDFGRALEYLARKEEEEQD
jgi:hypothetical protein